MRAVLTGCMGLAACWAVTARAQYTEAGPVRRVQLIPMGEMVSVDRTPTAANNETAAEAHVGAHSVSARTLAYWPDARSVELQMFDRLQTQALPTEPGEPLAAARAGRQVRPDRVAPVSAILAPMWMRPGSVYSAEAWRFVPGCASPGYRPTGFLGADAELRRASYYGMMSRIACEYEIPVGLFDAMIIRESRYHPTAVSPRNAFGLTQLMPATAAGLGIDRYNVEGNLRGGARYLRQQLDRFGQYHLALAAYNAGPGRVRGGAIPRIRETQAYVGNVLLNWSRLSGLQRQAVTFSVDDATLLAPAASPARNRRASVSSY